MSCWVGSAAPAITVKAKVLFLSPSLKNLTPGSPGRTERMFSRLRIGIYFIIFFSLIYQAVSFSTWQKRLRWVGKGTRRNLKVSAGPRMSVRCRRPPPAEDHSGWRVLNNVGTFCCLAQTTVSLRWKPGVGGRVRGRRGWREFRAPEESQAVHFTM